eukprot:m.137120 g.137120  ORF g.137120 m.137120 type:complete len:109 (+) comp13148_c0_seq7:103-429(+)
MNAHACMYSPAHTHIYSLTYPHMQTVTAVRWLPYCDGFAFMTDKHDDDLPTVVLPILEESRQDLWLKTRCLNVWCMFVCVYEVAFACLCAGTVSIAIHFFLTSCCCQW